MSQNTLLSKSRLDASWRNTKRRMKNGSMWDSSKKKSSAFLLLAVFTYKIVIRGILKVIHVDLWSVLRIYFFNQPIFVCISMVQECRYYGFQTMWYAVFRRYLLTTFLAMVTNRFQILSQFVPAQAQISVSMVAQEKIEAFGTYLSLTCNQWRNQVRREVMNKISPTHRSLGLFFGRTLKYSNRSFSKFNEINNLHALESPCRV